MASSPPAGEASSGTPPAATPISPAPGAIVGLIVRLTWCQDTCPSNPGTTVLDDGRVIWRTEAGWVERRLTAAGLAWLRGLLDQTGALDASGDYSAQLRPGAEPMPRGVTAYVFHLVRGPLGVKVTTGEPEDYESEPGLWIIPPEMTVLAPVARSLQDPAASFPADAWAGPSAPFLPPSYLLLISARPGAGARPELPTDVDDVAWPFTTPLDQLGSPYLTGGEVPEHDRCLPISADLAQEIAAAEAASGRPRGLDVTLFELGYRWARGDGFVTVSTQWLMPDQPWSCSASISW